MKNMNAKDLANLYVKEVISKYNPKFKIRPKSESKLFKLFKPILLLINPKFFDTFITVMFGTMWIPDGYFEKANRFQVLKTMAHEGLHERRRKKLPFLVFELAYTFPQNLFLIFLPLGIFHSWLWFIAAAISLLPLPAWFRYKIEMEGYSTRKLWYELGMSYNLPAEKEMTVYNLANLNGGYFAPMPIRAKVRKDFMKPLNRQEERYKEIIDFLKRHEIIH